eukprot:scaffold211079_cov25-Tisochrysis_lutea.AAC.3
MISSPRPALSSSCLPFSLASKYGVEGAAATKSHGEARDWRALLKGVVVCPLSGAETGSHEPRPFSRVPCAPGPLSTSPPSAAEPAASDALGTPALGDQLGDPPIAAETRRAS